MNQCQIKWKQLIRQTVWEGFGHWILYSLIFPLYFVLQRKTLLILHMLEPWLLLYEFKECTSSDKLSDNVPFSIKSSFFFHHVQGHYPIKVESAGSTRRPLPWYFHILLHANATHRGEQSHGSVTNVKPREAADDDPRHPAPSHSIFQRSPGRRRSAG